MEREILLQKLFQLQDSTYRSMQLRILPTLPPEQIIGVRTPDLRSLSKELANEKWLLESLPHTYFEENQLHSFVISGIRDFSAAAAQIERFLPAVNNWATCDQMNPVCFRKNRAALLPYIEKWIYSEHPYTVRFAIKMLMDHYLDADFSPRYLDMAASIRREEYYIRMMIAWYFATALAKQFDSALPFLTQHRLETWTHNKTIQKAVESYRIPSEHKITLKELRIR